MSHLARRLLLLAPLSLGGCAHDAVNLTASPGAADLSPDQAILVTHVYTSDYMPWNLVFKSGLSTWTAKNINAPGKLEVIKVDAGTIQYGTLRTEVKGGTVNYIGDIRIQVQGVMRGAVSTVIVDNEKVTMAEARAAVPELFQQHGYEKNLLHAYLASPDEPISLVTLLGQTRTIPAPALPAGCDAINYRTSYRQAYVLSFNDVVRQIVWEGSGITEKLEAERLAVPVAPFRPAPGDAGQQQCFDTASAAGKKLGDSDAHNLPAANPHAK